MFVLVLYSYTFNDKQQARAVFYEFIMVNKHEVLGSKAKLWRSGGEAPSCLGNRKSGSGTPSVWRLL